MLGFGPISETALGSSGRVAVNASVTAVGLSATGAIGSPAASVAPAPVGLSATCGIGSPTPAITSAPAGISATCAIGTVTILTGRTATVVGVSATAAIGSPVASAAAQPAGLAAAAAAGSASAAVGATTAGLAATGAVGAAKGSSDPAPAGFFATAAAGASAAAVGPASVGLSATGMVGTVVAGLALYPPGMQAICVVGVPGLQESSSPGVAGIAATCAIGPVQLAWAVAPAGMFATGVIGWSPGQARTYLDNPVPGASTRTAARFATTLVRRSGMRGPDFPVLDAVVAQKFHCFDFGPELPAGVTLVMSPEPTVTATVVEGCDPDPQARWGSSPQLVPSEYTGADDCEVGALFGFTPGGRATYDLACVATDSTGQTRSCWGRLPVRPVGECGE